MSLWTRLVNALRPERIDRAFDEEMGAHIEDAIEAGRDPAEARRAFGRALAARERSHDVRAVAWLDGVRADVIFGWRQLRKNKASSAVAVLSLALTIGACTAAFRLADAVLLRPLPVAEPGRLFRLEYEYVDDRTGTADRSGDFDYPSFREMRAAVKGDAELMAVSGAGRPDLTYGSEQEMEKAWRQHVSGWTFGAFGLKPALGRLLTAADDVKPGAHPYAVLSYDYWTRRFGRDPKVLGRTFRIDRDVYQIAGVVEEGFTGTEPGTMTDIFVPVMMRARAVEDANWGWLRVFVRPMRAANPAALEQKLRAVFAAARRARLEGWSRDTPKERRDEYANAPLYLEPGAAGFSGLQQDLRRPLAILAAVVGLVLLIACGNVANLMTAQAESRSREMALRVSIGAGRARLVQLVLAESALLALAGSVLGVLFAWLSTPLVVGMMSSPGTPIRLMLPLDWRVLGFAAGISAGVTILFGAAPALRASGVQPSNSLRGGDGPRSKRRLMSALVAAQVAFCVVVHMMAGMFVSTFERLSKQPTGFAADGVLTLETVSAGEQPPVYWEQVLERLRGVPGVESAALCNWALMSGNEWTSDVYIGGRRVQRTSSYFLSVSPGWLGTMRIPLVDGHDFRPGDAYPATAIVNEAFARSYFGGANPVGRRFELHEKDKVVETRIAGWVRDARYHDMRERVRPTVYVPFRAAGGAGGPLARDWATLVVRTPGDPLALAPVLRAEVPRARAGFRVTGISTQRELVEQHTVPERLLATLSVFFGSLALLLAGVGLYGVLHFSVLERRREIGIRMALGARAPQVARSVTAGVARMLVAGGVCGVAIAIGAEKYVRALLYEVKVTDPPVLAVPLVAVVAMSIVAAIPPVARAVRTDPAVTLRGD